MNQEHRLFLSSNRTDVWNHWRKTHPDVRPDLSGAYLSEMNQSGHSLRGINLSGADLSGADLSFLDLYGVDLSGANLSEARLSNADLRNVNLSGANLSGAYLYEVDLSGATISQEQLDTTSNYKRSRLPPGRTPDIRGITFPS